MTTERELLEQALEALAAMQMEASAMHCGLKICDDAITAIREYLAKPESDLPVAWVSKKSSAWFGAGNGIGQFSYVQREGYEVPIYLHPPRQQEDAKDAGRYRYLRSANRRECLDLNGPEAGCWIDCEDESHTLILLTEADADSAIDAAIEQEKSK